jgi:hypothetical protein
MPVPPRDECQHAPARPLGTVTNVPAAWVGDAALPDIGGDLESGWCTSCDRYLWRELGCPYWIAFDPPG